MTDKLRLRDRPLPSQPRPINRIFFPMRDGKVENAEARDIMKKMRPLAEHEIHLRQGRLDDGFGPADLAEVDRDAAERISRAPAAETDEKIGHMRRRQFLVQLFQLAGDRLRLMGAEFFGLDVDDVLNIVKDAVA